MKLSSSLRCYWKNDGLVLFILALVTVFNSFFVSFTLTVGNDSSKYSDNAWIFQILPCTVVFIVVTSIINICIPTIFQINFSVNRYVISKALIIVNIIKSIGMALILTAAVYLYFAGVDSKYTEAKLFSLFGYNFYDMGIEKYVYLFIVCAIILYLLAVILNLISIIGIKYGTYFCISSCLIVLSCIALVFNYIVPYFVLGLYSTSIILVIVLAGILVSLVNYSMVLRIESKN